MNVRIEPRGGRSSEKGGRGELERAGTEMTKHRLGFNVRIAKENAPARPS
jgi:hypothetical protein